MRRYPIAYKVETPKEHPPRTPDELRDADLGGCDAIIIHSILFRADGSRSEAIVTKDGRTGDELPVDELFKSWAMLAHGLSQDKDLGEGRRLLAEMVHEILREIVTGGESPLLREAVSALARRRRPD